MKLSANAIVLLLVGSRSSDTSSSFYDVSTNRRSELIRTRNNNNNNNNNKQQLRRNLIDELDNGVLQNDNEDLFRMLVDGMSMSMPNGNLSSGGGGDGKKMIKIAYISSKYYPDRPPNNNAVADWGYNDEYMFDFSLKIANEESWCGDNVTLVPVKFQANGTADDALVEFIQSQLNDKEPPDVFLGADWGPVSDAVIQQLDTTKENQNIIGAGATGSNFDEDPVFFRTTYSDGDTVPLLTQLMLSQLEVPSSNDNLEVRVLYLSDNSYGFFGYKALESYIKLGTAGTDSFPKLSLPPPVTMTSSMFTTIDSVDAVTDTVTTLLKGADSSNTVVLISASGPGTTTAFLALEKAGYSAQYNLHNTPPDQPWVIGALEAPPSVILDENDGVSPQRLQAAAGYLYYENLSELIVDNCANTLQNQYKSFQEEAKEGFPNNKFSSNPLTGGFSYYSYDLMRITCKAFRYREELGKEGTDLTLGEIVRLDSFPGVQGTSGIFLKLQNGRASADKNVNPQMFHKLVSKGKYNSTNIDYDDPYSYDKDQFECPFQADFFPEL